VIEAPEGAVIKLLKPTFTVAVLAVALVHVSVVALANAATEVVSKSDLGISLSDAGASTEGKGDCDCAASLDGSNTAENGSHRDDGENIPAAAITRAAVKTNRKDLKSVAAKDGVFLHMKAGRVTACVFGAPNASGCGN
jgi:hypothetical protein